jgi:heat shock protein 1/8
MGGEMGSKISPEDKAKMEDAIKGAISWLESHQAESTEVYEEKQKEMDAIVHPITTSAYASQGGGTPTGGSTPGTQGGTSGRGPVIEEVD